MISNVLPNEYKQVVSTLHGHLGVRLGDTTVLSTKVHVLDPTTPNTIYIMMNSDAGQIFYHRRIAGEVIHLDIFHELAKIKHRAVAKAIIRALAQYRLFCQNHHELKYESDSLTRFLDYIDVQTATGGGRVTGLLSSGKKRSLRHAHLSHCHITLLLPSLHYRLLFYIVDNVEACICTQGFELRKIENLVYEQSYGRSGLDLSPYRDKFDSYLTESSYGLYQEKEWQPQDIGLSEMSDDYGITGIFDLYTEPMLNSMKFTKNQQDRRLQNQMSYDKPTAKKTKTNAHFPGLEKKIFIKQRFSGHDGKFKQSMTPKHAIKYQSAYRARTASKTIKGSLATAITVKQALLRLHADEDIKNGFTISKQDVHYYYQIQRRAQHLVIVLDCSESMEGKRLRAAEGMIMKILTLSNDKVAIVTAQENSTKLICPFTRNRLLIQTKMQQLKPRGLTPLAAGLEKAYTYLTSAFFRNPRVLMITDGVPTLSLHGYSPVHEAECAAEKIAEGGIPFTCIGLQPNKHLLQRIVVAGQGNLYIIKELKLEPLMEIYQSEKTQAQA